MRKTMSNMLSNILEETINLKNIIKRIVRNEHIESIYLFGSRAFKTGSSRSDIDLILFGTNIDNSFIDDIYSRCNALDVFKGCESYIVSTISGSEIRKEDQFNDMINEQLRAVLLWSKDSGYVNEEFYIQKHYIGQRHFPSGRPQMDSFSKFKSLLNNPSLSPNCQYCFQESIFDYLQECYLSCVSLLGLSCEYLLKDLIESYEKRYNSVYSNSDFHDQVVSCRYAKPRLLKLEEFINRDISYFNSNGFQKLTEFFVVFNIIRMYRNDADHPNQYQFSKSECDALFSSMTLGLETVINVTKHLNDTYH